MKLNVDSYESSQLFTSTVSVFFWGLIAHMYGFVNGIFSHDSLNALVADTTEEIWKLQLGRFMVPIYRQIVREGIAMPWLIGMLALIFISLTVYLTVKLFDIKSSWPIFLIAGVYTTNLTVTALTGTYIYELDLDMLALLLATAAVYCWHSHKLGFLPGAVLLAISMGFYQAYYSVAIVLIMLVSMMALINKQDFKSVFRKGCIGITMLLMGGMIYAFIVSTVCALTGIELANTYNGLTNLFAKSDYPLWAWIMDAYLDCFRKIVHLIPGYSNITEVITNGILFGISAGAVITVIIRKKIKPLSVILLLLLGGLMPLGMNILYILDRGIVHDLMIFPFYSIYLLVLLLVFQSKLEGKYLPAIKAVTCILMAVLLWGNVQSSNALYVKKDLEKESTLSVMTRVVERIEAYPDYVAGETPVAIYGKYEQNTIEGFSDYSNITGADSSSAISVTSPSYYFNIYKAYFSYVLNCEINLCDREVWYQLRDSRQLDEMPCFPNEECINMIDGVLVVKMSSSY